MRSLSAVLPTPPLMFDTPSCRRLEAAAAASLAPHALMQRAGLGVARLALAVAPHARRIVVLSGPGNNGGDGLEAAMHLHRAGRNVQVHLLGQEASMPADATASLQRARDAGVALQAGLPARIDADLAIDALLGIGSTRPPQGAIAEAIRALCAAPSQVLAVDLPTGLNGDTGSLFGEVAVRAAHTLSLLALHPGLFTGQGRDHAGAVWLDDLGVPADPSSARARLAGLEDLRRAAPPRRHAQHKGSFGDVLVIGGAPGMSGAALLAARAAATAGAGRVYASLLDGSQPLLDVVAPELMLRSAAWDDEALVSRSTVVCGCGGGDRVREVLPVLIARAARLVLDADALNAVAADPMLATLLARRRGATLMTPHPLEAARLLGSGTAEVQRDRLLAAETLAQRMNCAVLLKGSGSAVAAPGIRTAINPTGNALLASAGTGDVLAGWAAGCWAQQDDDSLAAAAQAAISSAMLHGLAADEAAAAGRRLPWRASALAEAMAQTLQRALQPR